MTELLALGAVAIVAGSAARLRFPVREMEVSAVAAYVSRTRFRVVPPGVERARDLVQAVKQGDRRAVEAAADLLAAHPDLVGFDGVVIPAPRSTPCRQVLNPLACALLKRGVGRRVVPALARVEAVPSSRMLRRMGRGGVTPSRHYRSMRVLSDALPPDAPLLVVDDMTTDGNTMLAGANRLRDAGHSGTIRGASVGWVAPDPGGGLEPFAPVRLRVAMRRGVVWRQIAS